MYGHSSPDVTPWLRLAKHKDSRVNKTNLFTAGNNCAILYPGRDTF